MALRPGRSRRFRGFQPAGTVGLASGESAREVAGQLRRDFWPTLALEWVAQLVESAILAVPQLTTMASSGGPQASAAAQIRTEPPRRSGPGTLQQNMRCNKASYRTFGLYSKLRCVAVGPIQQLITGSLKRCGILTLTQAMWAPLDIANFALVPVRHQLLLVSSKSRS